MKTKPILLIVDDDHKAMSYFVMALENSGYRVTQKCTASDAIDFLSAYSQTVDGVILDMMLPLGHVSPTWNADDEMFGGKEVYRYLQSTHPGIPILVLSNISSGRLLNEFPSSDTVQVAVKCEHSPFMIVDLINRLVGSTSSGGDEEHTRNP